MSNVATDQKVIVVDFGAQYGQLIARRVRDLGVYSEIVPCDITAEEVRAIAPAAIILSGGPASVYAEDAPSIDPGILALGIPVLGFCYGQQAMAVALGGKWATPRRASTAQRSSRGRASRPLFDSTPVRTDGVDEPPRCCEPRARGLLHHVAHRGVPCGVHGVPRAAPVRHAVPPRCATPSSANMLRNFLFGVCELERDWTMDSIIDDSIEAIRVEVGGTASFLRLSGGVDSTVVAALCAPVSSANS